MRRMVPLTEWLKVKEDLLNLQGDVEHLKGVEISNIKSISTEILDGLKCGDLVIKKTGNERHAYRVTYKEEKHGICLSYYDAGYLETVSYDYNSGTHKWVYNSTDVITVASEDYVNNAIDTAITGAINNTY